MSEISSNYGMESLNIAMMKRSQDSQGKVALQLLEGAAQSTQQVAKVAAPAPTAVDSGKGNIIDVTA